MRDGKLGARLPLSRGGTKSIGGAGRTTEPLLSLRNNLRCVWFLGCIGEFDEVIRLQVVVRLYKWWGH
jgi:hypothetical protein